MKKLVLMATAMLCCAAITVSCNQGQNGQQLSQEQPATQPAAVTVDNDVKVTIDELPQAAKDLLDKNFGGKEVNNVTTDNDDFTVYYKSGEKVEFDKQGALKEVENMAGVPAALIPEKIKAAAEAAFAGAIITQFDHKDDGGYEVKLNNGKEIEFNSAFEQVRIDD